jgi:ABC-type sugar transport system substrate-binding protein
LNTRIWDLAVGASKRLVKANKWLLALSLALTFSSCAAPTTQQSEYFFVLVSHNSDHWKAVRDGIEETAATEGIVPVVKFADEANKDDPNWCQTALARKAKIIVFGGIHFYQELECFTEAQKLDIKCADIDGNVTDEKAKKANVTLAFSINTDDAYAGKRAAEYVASKKKRVDPKVLIIAGMPLRDDVRVNGFKNALKALVPEAQIVKTAVTKWDRDQASKITAEVLKTTPDLDFVFSDGDWMALGAGEAAEAAGKGKQVMIIGIGGFPFACAAVKAGTMSATVAMLPAWIGERAVQKAIEVVQGKPTAPKEHAPILLVTKEVLSAKKDPMLKYLR